jgi:anti-sigma B factor antagonist
MGAPCETLPDVQGQSRRCALCVDLSGVDYADSSGLGFLMLLHGRVKTKGGQLRLAGPNKSLLDLFKLTGTDSILTIDPNCTTALSS